MIPSLALITIMKDLKWCWVCYVNWLNYEVHPGKIEKTKHKTPTKTKKKTTYTPVTLIPSASCLASSQLNRLWDGVSGWKGGCNGLSRRRGTTILPSLDWPRQEEGRFRNLYNFAQLSPFMHAWIIFNIIIERKIVIIIASPLFMSTKTVCGLMISKDRQLLALTRLKGSWVGDVWCFIPPWTADQTQTHVR